ncbi:uncharacterized protein LOC127257011 isoform X2 [Andrographis paniculata]|nr:uncharacterized protein LOC127257011 isoform X2 [Andrographis paniculata]
MGKKKFIDKKKAATFQLMARDTSDPLYSSGPDGDRVFVRVDNNRNAPDYFNDGEPNDAADVDSIFADAPEDCTGDDLYGAHEARTAGLPDHVRKEILELGFPDDGYNYLLHLREIKNTGGGSVYYDNPKASFDHLPQDVKAYDASRVAVSKINDASEEEKLIYNSASKMVGIKLQKVVDPEVAAMLEDDNDSAKFGSDVEELEEDFVVRANIFEGPIHEDANEKTSFAAASSPYLLQQPEPGVSTVPKIGATCRSSENEKPRERRPLDEQFDMLMLNEYGDESEDEYNGYDYDDDDDDCQESLTEKLNSAFKNHPSDHLLHKPEADDVESPEVTVEVLRRCKEYAEKYEDEDDNVEEVLDEESSSDESEKWDCETIVTTYSTLDNHPGKISAPEPRRKKKLSEALSGASSGANPVITLKGKERLPVDFLPRNRKLGEEKMKEKDSSDRVTDMQKKKPRAQESKEEKKARKSAVKSERREARQVKKEMKGLYKSEAHRAQKVAAFTGPSSIHLM